ncbi:MAG: hypothetical protein AAF468_16740 [Pseudomonadota bacterium]
MTKKYSIAALIALAALGMSGTPAYSDTSTKFQNLPTDVRFVWHPRKRKVVITYYTGCRSAHGAPKLYYGMKAYLDRDYLQFDIQGSYRIRKFAVTASGKRIGSADCMGAQQSSYTFENVERETYVINRHGHHVRDVRLGNTLLDIVIPDPRSPRQAVKKPAMFLITKKDPAR